MAPGQENGATPSTNNEDGLDKSPSPESSADTTADASSEPKDLKKSLTNGIKEESVNDPEKKPKKKQKNKAVEEISDDDSVYQSDVDQADSELTKLKDKAPNRIRQFGQYLRIMEARMAAMEAELSELKKDPSKVSSEESEEKKESEPASEEPKKGEPICEIKTGDMDFFDRIIEGDDDLSPDIHGNSSDWRRKRSDQKWVIEVLTRTSYTQVTPDTDKSAKKDDSNSSSETSDQDASQPAKIQHPERIRIRSEILLEYLRTLVKGEHNNFDGVLMFVAPFKLFVKNEERIRTRLTELEEQVKKDGDKSKEKDEESKQAKKDKETREKNAKLLPHLRLLVQLLDTLLAPTIKIYKSLTAQTATHVSFDHIYYLFSYGQEVLCADGTNQVYRVYGFTGGRDTLVPREDDDWQPGFTVDTYGYASNGQSYGPLPRQFIISRYYGQREITSLPVYPLQYHPKADELRKDIEKRGDTYIELSSQEKVIHRQYTGTSLDMPPEEVCSLFQRQTLSFR